MSQTSNQLIGKVLFITEIENKGKNGKDFLVLQSAIHIEVQFQGMDYSHDVGFQVTGKKAEDFYNQVNVGDEVEIIYGLRGNFKEDITKQGTPKNPNAGVCYTNVSANRFTVLQSKNAAPAPAPAQAATSVASVSGTMNTPAAESADDLPF